MINPIFNIEYFIKCSSCKIYTKTLSDKIECNNCDKHLKRANSEYFVYLPITQQLNKSIDEHFEAIMSYRDRITRNDNNVITDIQDSVQFKKSQCEHSNEIVLSLTANTDGAQMFNSSTKSLWPIQIYQNFLPPHIRYNPENIIVVALHSGKPNMQDFFQPLLNELKEIYDDGGINYTRNDRKYQFLPLITCCTADLPAKAAVQGTVSHNGYYACRYCLHKGEVIKKNKQSKAVIRYTRNNSLSRTHKDILDTYKKLKQTPLNGIKSVSCMIAANDFDLVNGFSIDYMHCVLLGVVKKLLNLWLETENHAEPYYILKKKQIVLSSRIITIKPIFEINRKPRSIFERKLFKANEFRTLLLYYLRYCLIDMLPMRYINHFQLLSSAVYMLLQEKITNEDICTAETNLNKFADQFEELYGKHNVTINLHLLRHLANSVRHNGPLWAHSAFAFETNNGVLIRTSHATNNFLMDLSYKYVMKKSLKNSSNEKSVQISGKTNIRISLEEKSILNEFGFNFDSDILTIYKVFTLRGTKFSSLKSKEISTVDYFVELRTGEIGSILYHLYINDMAYAFVQLYNVSESHDHLKKIYPLSKKIIINVNLIERKLMYIKVSTMQAVVVSIPNNFEKA